MKRMLVLLGLLAMLAVSAYAQNSVVNANVPFEFVASGKTLPAGNYVFSLTENRLTVRNKDNGNVVAASVLTRIAGSEQMKAAVTFDVSGGKSFLEAVWAGQGDGYLIHTVKGEHTHAVVSQQ